MKSPEISAVDEKFIFDVPPNPANSFRLRVTLLQDATLLCFGIAHHICDGNDCWEVVKVFCVLLPNKPIPLFALPPDAGDVRMSDLMKVKNECTETESSFYYQTHGSTNYGLNPRESWKTVPPRFNSHETTLSPHGIWNPSIPINLQLRPPIQWTTLGLSISVAFLSPQRLEHTTFAVVLVPSGVNSLFSSWKKSRLLRLLGIYASQHCNIHLPDLSARVFGSRKIIHQRLSH